jgi:hypothetical protein
MAACPHSPPLLSPSDISLFHQQGYLTVRGLLSASEAQAAAATFEAFMDGSLPVEGKDRGEHMPGLLNVTAFTLSHPMHSLPAFQLVHERCAALVEQLYGTEPPMARDYASHYSTQVDLEVPCQQVVSIVLFSLRVRG